MFPRYDHTTSWEQRPSYWALQILLWLIHGHELSCPSPDVGDEETGKDKGEHTPVQGDSKAKTPKPETELFPKEYCIWH